MKKTLTKQIVAGVAVLSILGGGIYIAKQDAWAADTNATATVTASSTAGKFKHSFGLVRQFSDELLTLMKLDEATLKEKLVAGQSLAQIAEAQGVTRDALKSLLVIQANQLLDEQKTEFSNNLDSLMDSTDLGKMAGREGHGGKGGHAGKDGHGGKGGPGGFGGGHGGKGGLMGPDADLSGLATILGYTDVAALKTALQEGNTITELATSQKVDIQLVKDEVTKQIQAHLDEELASGEITQAKYDELKADISNRVDDIVNHQPHARGMR
jgi:hypothetical protein